MNMLTTIHRCAGPGMSDDQLANERYARQVLDQAINDMRHAITALNHYSAVMSANPDAFEDFVHDWLPSEVSWDEKIAEARRP